MRNKFKSKSILLPVLFNLNIKKEDQALKKTSVFFCLSFLKEYFLVYNGYHYVSTRIRLPFLFTKLTSFLQTRSKFDLIPAKFKRISVKTSNRKK